ncbi:MAG: lipopolysaccharide heptosyltransferase II [Candidatus Aminicenantes bacterium]|nr:MAG: lipopolysaccharide heptosyltransferase II [Candidatus Aminicenantes bacterium]
MKIIVRAPNWIGDAVLSVPSIESLSKNFPRAQIWVAATEWVKDLFTSYDFIKGVVSLSDLNTLKGIRNSAQNLKKSRFETGVLLTNSFSSAFLFYLAKIPERWGYVRDGRGLLLTRGVSPKGQGKLSHQLNYYLELISGLSLKTYPPEISLPLTQDEMSQAKERLLSLNVDLGKPLVLLNPGASYGPAKRWPASRFAELASLYQQRKNVEILIIGSSDESELAESIVSSMPKKPLSLVGKTSLRLLAGLISHAALFITNDSGPMHLANALKIPVTAIFGPTDPRLTGPFQEPAVVLKKDVPCWPCSYRECPFDHGCMRKIGPEEVFEAGQKFLSL